MEVLDFRGSFRLSFFHEGTPGELGEGLEGGRVGGLGVGSGPGGPGVQPGGRLQGQEAFLGTLRPPGRGGRDDRTPVGTLEVGERVGPPGEGDLVVLEVFKVGATL